MLHAIKKGAALGTSTELPSKDPFSCRNGHILDLEAEALQEELVEGLRVIFRASLSRLLLGLSTYF